MMMLAPVHAKTGWQADLQLRYRREGERTIAHDLHSGPLRVLQALYPEGSGVCHHVLVHPPGGIVGGDELRLRVEAGEGSQALLTTPGATRFYRSAGAWAQQHTTLKLAADARLEWLPMETIAHSACLARNTIEVDIAPGARLLGWDLLALGLPAAQQPFEQGEFINRLQWPGVWLEQARIEASDKRLLQSPLGMAGRTCTGTLFLASGTAFSAKEIEALLDAAREAIAGQLEVEVSAGVTALDERLLVLRLLAQHTEQAMALLRAVRARWRPMAMGLPAGEPRIWRQ